MLLVDDEPSALNLLKRQLDKESYRVLVAKSGEEGLDLLYGTNVDVIVSDEKMPSMTGTEFLTKAKRDFPQTIRIMITGHATLESAMKAIQDDLVYQYLHKPVSSSDFINAIQNGLALKMLRKVGFKENGRAITDLPPHAASAWKPSPNKKEAVEAFINEILVVIEQLKSSESVERAAVNLRDVIDVIRAKYS